jgi:hypothetical protein
MSETLLATLEEILRPYSEYIHIAERGINLPFQGSISYVHPSIQKLQVIKFTSKKQLTTKLNRVCRL